MHINSDASVYVENVWLWVADHDIDDPRPEDNSNDMVISQLWSLANGRLADL